VLLKRYSLMAMGFARNTLGQLTGIYVPSPVEVFLALGILSFGLLFITISMKVLPMETPEDEDDDDLAPFRAKVAADAALEAEVTSL
jgi:Ni/Fe-hydrogenase subunit HybB-like protein